MDLMPRTLTVAEVSSSQPSKRPGYIGSLDVCDNLSQKTLYKIHRYEETSAEEMQSGVYMELVCADQGNLLSRWSTPAGFISCVCCCKKCLPKLKRRNTQPEFSLMIASSSGSVQGYIKLTKKSIKVLNANKEKLYKIACEPVDQQYQIAQVNAKHNEDTARTNGSLSFDQRKANIQLPTTDTVEHDILVLAGVFALHFMPHLQPHLRAQPESDERRDYNGCMDNPCWEETCFDCLLSCCFRSWKSAADKWTCDDCCKCDNCNCDCDNCTCDNCICDNCTCDCDD